MLSATFSHLFSVAVPALPGATKTFATFSSCAIFHANACSRPPLPKTKMFILLSFFNPSQPPFEKGGASRI